MDSIVQELFKLQDTKYAEFQSKLIPTVDADRIIGVRTPDLRKLAKDMVKSGEYAEILQDLPHKYFEEYQLHAFVISLMRDFDAAMNATEEFLPYVDNWATCDQLIPKAFSKHKAELLEHILVWLKSDKMYTVRFGLGMLMRHFVDEDFEPSYLELAASVKSDEYYVNMMIAWYFSVLLVKQYDYAVKYIEQHRLDKWVHNKTIQKAVESFRITDEKKVYLKTLRRG